MLLLFVYLFVLVFKYWWNHDISSPLSHSVGRQYIFCPSSTNSRLQGGIRVVNICLKVDAIDRFLWPKKNWCGIRVIRLSELLGELGIFLIENELFSKVSDERTTYYSTLPLRHTSPQLQKFKSLWKFAQLIKNFTYFAVYLFYEGFLTDRQTKWLIEWLMNRNWMFWALFCGYFNLRRDAKQELRFS